MKYEEQASARDISVEELDRNFRNMPNAFFLMKVLLDSKGEPYDWVYLYANEAVLSNVGIPRENFINRSFFEIFGEKGNKKWLKPYYEAAYEGKSCVLDEYSSEVRRFVQMTCFQYAYGYAACIVRDIMQTHLYQKALRSTALSYREIFFIDLIGDFYQSVYITDEAIPKESGSYREAIDQRFKSGRIFSDDEEGIRRFLAAENVKEALKKKDYIEYKYCRKNPAGEPEWCLVSFTAGEYQDDYPVTAIMTIRSIDELVKTEQSRQTELQRAMEAAEEANHAKSDFLSSVSHDIRTPLNAIINLASMLREEMDDHKKMEEDIQKIEVAGEFLLQLVNDILDVSKIESGKITLSPRVYTYETFLNYIKGIIHPLCEEKDINFILDEGPTAFDIYMDRVRFHQIFFNLLSNAVKYTPPGGTVIFRTTNNVVHDGILTCDFVVEDNGIGISEEFLKRAYDPFEREDSQNAYVGTGLGLTICKKLVDLMGGVITIESKLGKGTKVTVHMDLSIATEEQREESKAEMNAFYHRDIEQTSQKGSRILVVEDNGVNREILKRLLEKKDYSVDIACDGQEAVDKVKSRVGSYYQAVLMDIRMPVMDGLEATKRIRQDPDENRRNVPIIAITANAFENDVRECLEAGMNAHLAKPISPGELYSVIANYVLNNDEG